MKRGLVITLVVIGVLLLIGLAYYFLIYKPSQAVREGSSGTNGTDDTPSPPITTGQKVYLKLDAPAPGAGYGTNETVVYNAPVMAGAYVLGKLHRNWYGNQPIGTVISDNGEWVKVKVGMLSDFRIYPFINSDPGKYDDNSVLVIASGTGSKEVYFRREYLTIEQY